MLLSKCVAVLFSLMILGNAIVVRRIVGTWLFPAAIFSLLWFAYTFIPLVALFPVPANPLAVAFIFAGTLAFSASAFVMFRWKLAFRLNRRKPPASDYFDTPFLRAVFHSTSLASLACFYVGMVAQGFTLADMFSGVVQTASAYAELRYGEALIFSLYTKLSLPLAYIAVSAGGLLFGSSRSKSRSATILIGSFLPAVATMLFQSSKGMLFLVGALFVGGILVTRIFSGRLYLIDRGTIQVILGVAVVVVPLTTWSFLSRGLSSIDDGDLLRTALSQTALSYAFGHMYAFADWFSFRIGQGASLHYANDPTSYGFYTFMSVFRLFGSARDVPIGIYDEFYTYGDLMITNVYTIYRGIITDFGLVGALLYALVSGCLIHLAFYFLLIKRRPVASVALFLFTIGYIYQSFAISLFTWNTMPVVSIALGCCLWINNRLRTRSVPASASSAHAVIT